MYKVKDRYIFLFFWIIAFFTFIIGYNAGWCYDAMTFSYIIEGKSLKNLLMIMPDSTNRYFYQGLEYVAYKVFGKQGFDWYLFKITLHTSFVFLFYLICNKLFGKFRINKKYSFFIALLTLISPYTTEIVLYQVTLQYVCGGIFIFLSILSLINFIHTNKIKYIVFYLITNIIAILFSEYTFVMPMFALAFVIIFSNNIVKHVLIFCSISIMILLIYLASNFALHGDVVGHYGSDRHFNLSVETMVSNFLYFLFDNYFFTQYWSFDKAQNCYQFIMNQYIVVALLALLGLIILLIKIKKSQYIKQILFSLLILIISILPVLNIWFHVLTPIEGDRYYYSSICFAFLFLFILIYYLNKKFLSIAFMFLLITNFIILQKNALAWNRAQNIIDNSISTFKYEQNKRYMFLAVADRIDGALIFGSDESKERPFNISDFAIALCTKVDMSLDGKIGQVLNYNVTSESICPIIEIINDTTLKYTLPCCGQWWWKRRHGATDFENDYYRVKMIGGWQQEVLVTFKQKPKDMIYMYQCGEKFVELKF